MACSGTALPRCSYFEENYQLLEAKKKEERQKNRNIEKDN
jgi:hypothetical protein